MNTLSTKLLIPVYSTLLHSFVNYYIVVWGGAFKNTLQSMQILKNKVLKATLNYKTTDSEICQELYIPNIKELYVLNLMKMYDKNLIK